MIRDMSLIFLNFLSSANVTGPWVRLYLQTSAPISGVNQDLQPVACQANDKATDFQRKQEKNIKGKKKKKRGGINQAKTSDNIMPYSLAPCLKFHSGRTRTSVTGLLIPL